MTEEERWITLKIRRQRHYPHHAPPKPAYRLGFFIINASCFEHRHIMATRERRKQFSEQLIAHLTPVSEKIHAWVVLSNHYHIMVDINRPVHLRSFMGKLHGRMSYIWNIKDVSRGRKVFFHSMERPVRSQAHFFTALNYIHNNPVKHRYSKRWDEWETSSFSEFLREFGRDRAIEIWHAYPLRNYGDDLVVRSKY